jgi:hypothetical protein
MGIGTGIAIAFAVYISMKWIVFRVSGCKALPRSSDFCFWPFAAVPNY